jgi:transcriptional regulator with XRE-family HTH domain
MVAALFTMVKRKMTFTEWLEQELESRRWRQADLAQEMGSSEGMVSMVLRGERKPGPDFCNGIARAFGVPPETVFRMAGLLPALPEEDDELARQLVENFKRLPIEQRREILSYVFWKIQESRLRDTLEPGDNGTDQTL